MDALTRLGEEYLRLHFGADPFMASIFGVPGYDGEVPDPSRAAAGELAAALGRIEAELATLDPTDRVSHAVLTRLVHDKQRVLRDGVADVAVSASIAGPLAQVVSIVPTGTGSAEDYLRRLGQLAGFFDRHVERYREAVQDGRFPTAEGVRLSIDQVDAYLGTPVGRDPLVRDAATEDVIAGSFRPALVRYRAALADELLPVGRPDARVGLCHVPGGEAGYAGLISAYTTTELTPDEIHRTGLELVAALREEFAERGGRALGTGDVDEVLDRLRDDPALRFDDSAQIVEAVTGALRRAEEALSDWFHPYDIAPCGVREMDAAEAAHSVLGYYVPPAADGSRGGTHVINTYRPQLRARFEYEALAFHESVPGHHLQIAVAQSRTDLPAFRRFSYFDAHGEGWGLYAERLADEMGLYTSELSRLGMVSFDAWRACRLVVDTGMHHLGWSRSQAIAYLRANTALSDTNIVNEVDRYIAMPAQALAYMIGRLRIGKLRAQATDVRAFHHEVLAHGPLPLGTLDELLTSPH